MDKADFAEQVASKKEITFDPTADRGDRSIPAAWLSEAITDGATRVRLSHAVITGPFLLEPNGVHADIRLTSCELESIDVGGCRFEQILALRRCLVSGAVSATGCTFERGLSLQGTTIQQLSVGLCKVEIQLNATELTCGLLNANDTRIDGDLVLNGAQIETLQCQRLRISGNFHSSPLNANAVDAIGLTCWSWQGLDVTIAGDFIGEQLTVESDTILPRLRVGGQTNLTGARLAGGVVLRDAALHDVLLLGGRYGRVTVDDTAFTGDLRADYASFTTVQIANSTVSGGISLMDSLIRGSALIACTNVGGDLKCDRMTVGGTFEIRSESHPQRSSFRGILSVAGSRIGSQLIVANADMLSNLILASARIEADVILSNTKIIGSLLGDGCIINGALKALQPLQVSKDITLGRARIAAGVSFDDCTISGDLDATTARISTFLALRKAAIGGSLLLPHCHIRGPLNLQSCKVQGVINLIQASVDEIAFQAIFEEQESSDAARCERLLLAGCSYTRIRVAWRTLAKQLSADSANEDALSRLERYLRVSGLAHESEAVYLCRRRMEAGRSTGLLRLGLHLLDFFSGYGVIRWRIFASLLAIVMVSMLLCAFVPDFVVPKGTSCGARTVAGLQIGFAAAIQAFSPLRTQEGFNVSTCDVFWRVRASTIITSMQLLAASLLPVFVGTITGWFKTQATP